MSSGNENSENNNRIVGPIVPTTSNETNQPRQPINMQDLLRYAVEASRDPSSSNLQQLTEERRKFLEEVMSSMTVDYIREIAEAMTTLSSVNDPEFEKNPDIVSTYESALTKISDFVDHIDIANDFQKLNGFKLMSNCLLSKFDTVRCQASNIIAQCTQNNPFCQREAIKQQLIPKLIKMAELDKNDQCKIKAFYAISCIVRDSKEGLKHFEKLDGFSFLIRTLQSNNETLRTKSSFFVSSLTSCYPEIKGTLIKMGYVEQLIGLIQGEHTMAHEHMLSALLSLIIDNETARNECRRPELHLQSCLTRIFEEYKSDESFLEELEYIKQILGKVFSGEPEGER